MILYQEIREEIVKMGNKIATTGLVMGTWGNISAVIPGKELMAITPSGVDYETIQPQDIPILDFSGNVVDGNLIPSIEWSLHLEIYKARPDINGIIHTHSTFCTAMAVARKAIPGACEDMVQIVGGDVRVADYVLPGTVELGHAAVRAMENRNAVLLANHGLVGAAGSLKEAYKIVNVVEKSAQATVYATMMGGVVELSQSDIDAMRGFYLNSYGQRKG
jgi:L-fuculose-phosphate aldolase